MSNDLIHLITAVPINEPKINFDCNEYKKNDYSFDTEKRFKIFKLRQMEAFIAYDDMENWYYITSHTVNTLTEADITRRVYYADYMEEYSQKKKTLLQKELEQHGFSSSLEGYDKAITHIAYLTQSLKNLTLSKQAQIALIDSGRDPQIINQIHFLKNLFNGDETRFIAGAETYSFATVTENEYYFKTIHIERRVGLLYLLYFLYYLQHDIIPSKQMMARLLGNLWRSQQSMRTDWNSSLIEIEKITD